MTKKILYVGQLCSKSVLDYIFAQSKAPIGQAAPKFHRLLASGISKHKELCSVETLSSPPVTPSNQSRRVWRLSSETVGEIRYNYVSTINLPIIKNGLIFINAFFKTVVWGLSGGRKNKCIICDVLNVSISAAALLACKLIGIKAVGIVTDLPHLLVKNHSDCGTGRKFWIRLTSLLMSNYDGYLFLTEQMNDAVNVQRKPYIVMEGLVDSDMINIDNILENKACEKVLLYAGGIYEKYGIKKMIEAFMLLKGDDLRLHIYGSGEMEKNMPKYINMDNRIVYFGVVKNELVVQKQLEATLLINPRSSIEEFAKYSFPSKNMEYMVSGTPLVTTPLPGMPQEYYRFVYIFDDESIDGMHRTFEKLLAKPANELHEFGLNAKKFVLNQKSDVEQSKRVVHFLMSNLLN